VGFPKRNCTLLYYRGHYFRDTPATMSRWSVVVLTVYRYSRSLFRIIFYFKAQNRA